MFRSITNNTSKNLSAGGTISGDVTITGDLTVQGGGSQAFDEIIEGTSQVKITDTSAFLVEKADGTDVFIVDTTNSEVQIGSAPSTGQLQITGPIYNGAVDVDQFKAITMMIDGDSYWAQKAQFKLGRWEDAAGSHARSSLQIGLSHANVADDADADVNVMTLLSSGNVGIGTSSPEERIHSTGAIVSTGVNDTGATAGTERAFIDLVSNKARIGHFRGTTSAGSGGLQLYTDSVERMRIDASGNVGIGISSFWAGETTAHAEISATKAGDYAGLILRNENTDAGDSVSLNFGLARDGGLNFGNAGKILVGKEADFTSTPSTVDSFMAFHTILDETSSEKMRIDSAGRLGLGTTPKAFTLFTPLQISTSAVLTGRSGHNQVDLANNWYYDGSSKRINTGYATRYIQSSDGEHQFYTAGTDSADSAITFGTAKLTIDNAGNVGIGVSDPDSELEIFHATDPQIKFSINTHGDAGIILGDADGVKIFGKGASNEVRLYSGASTLAFRLDANSRISLSNNDAGLENTIFGKDAGKSIVAGADKNAFFGAFVADSTLTNGADFNAGFGYGALSGLTSGSYNTALGSASMLTATTATNNVCIGNQSNPSANNSTNQVVIGQGATGVADNSVTLGNADVTDVYMAQDSGATVHADYVLSQGNQNHVANTMSSPYYRTDGVDDFLSHTNITLLDVFTNNEDVSFEVLFKMPNTLNEQLFSYGLNGSNYIQFFTINGDLAFRTAGYGSLSIRHKVNQTLFEAGKIYHLAITMTDGAYPIIYVNGNLITYTAVSQTSDDAISNSGLQIGRGQLSSPAYGEFEFYRFKAFNLALDATEVKELYSGMSVPYKYKGANQTDMVTNGGFSSGSNWTISGGWDINTTTAGKARFLKDGSGIDYIEQNVGLIKGKRYRLTFTISDATNAQLAIYNNDTSSYASIQSSSPSFSNFTNTANGTYVVDFLATASGKLVIAGHQNSGSAWDLDDVSLVPIGAVYEYDGSSAGEKLWGDKSGNGKHLTVSGATLENAPYDAGTEYEEGLWTPTLTTSGTDFDSVTYDSLTGGKYVKIGNLVQVQGFLRTDAVTVGSASGNVRIGGLPYPLEDSTSGKADGHSSFTMGVSRNWAGENPTRMVADANTSSIGLYYQEHNADYGIVVIADVDTGANDNEIYFSGTYRT